MKIKTVLSFILIFTACQHNIKEHKSNQHQKSKIEMTERVYGMVDGKEIKEYTIQNTQGMSFSVINYGGIITKIEVPDKNGLMKDVALGFDDLAGYLGEHPYFGAIVGRYGNRISKGMFTIDDKGYQLSINDNRNSLHGGTTGFDKFIWQATSVERSEARGIMLTARSADGDQGYPGNLDVRVNYLLSEDNEIIIEYQASTDQPTVINLTNHSYFNLKGNGEGDVLDHELSLFANRFTPVDKTLIPTGELRSVSGTPFDFSEQTAIGLRINDDTNEQLKYGGGYDHNWVLSDTPGELKLAASVYEPSTGRFMEVLTTEPGVQFYTGNFLDGSTGKGARPYHARYGFCLETQHHPNSPNQQNFPSTVLRPGEEYHSQTVYRFSIQ